MIPLQRHDLTREELTETFIKKPNLGILSINIRKSNSSSQRDTEKHNGNNPGNQKKKNRKKKMPYGSWSSPISSFIATAAYNQIVGPPVVDPVTGNSIALDPFLNDSQRGASSDSISDFTVLSNSKLVCITKDRDFYRPSVLD